MSHTEGENFRHGGFEQGIKSHKATIYELTKIRPVTCPWRCLQEPFVREVIALQEAFETGSLPAFLSEEAPAVLHDALLVYRGSLRAVQAEDQRQESVARKKRLAQISNTKHRRTHDG